MLLTYTTRANVSSAVTFAPSSQLAAALSVTPFQSITYTASQMCGPPATNESIGFRNPGFHHTVLFSNLSSSQLYNFTITLITTPSAQRSGSFIGPVGASRHTPVDMLLFGDMGVWSPYNSRSYRLQKPAPDTVALMRSLAAASPNPMVILNIGDMCLPPLPPLLQSSYSSSSSSSYARGIAFLWDDFMASIEPLTQAAPFMYKLTKHLICLRFSPHTPFFPHGGRR